MNYPAWYNRAIRFFLICIAHTPCSNPKRVLCTIFPIVKPNLLDRRFNKNPLNNISSESAVLMKAKISADGSPAIPMPENSDVAVSTPFNEYNIPTGTTMKAAIVKAANLKSVL